MVGAANALSGQPRHHMGAHASVVAPVTADGAAFALASWRPLYVALTCRCSCLSVFRSVTLWRAENPSQQCEAGPPSIDPGGVALQVLRLQRALLGT